MRVACGVWRVVRLQSFLNFLWVEVSLAPRRVFRNTGAKRGGLCTPKRVCNPRGLKMCGVLAGPELVLVELALLARCRPTYCQSKVLERVEHWNASPLAFFIEGVLSMELTVTTEPPDHNVRELQKVNDLLVGNNLVPMLTSR